jgi:hypothetical protein
MTRTERRQPQMLHIDFAVKTSAPSAHVEHLPQHLYPFITQTYSTHKIMDSGVRYGSRMKPSTKSAVAKRAQGPVNGTDSAVCDLTQSFAKLSLAQRNKIATLDLPEGQ